MSTRNDVARTLRLELLGAPRVLLPEGKQLVLERRDAALMAVLALQGPTHRDRMISLLWPDTAKRTAQSNLRQRLFRLRQRAGFEIVMSDPLLAIATDVHHDLMADESNDGCSDLAIVDERPLLGSFEYEDCGELAEWVASVRERRATLHGERLAKRAAQLEGEGHIAEALAFAARLAAVTPTAEHAHRRLMRLHYRRGDRAAALAAHEHCRDVLARELGIRPGAETRELAALIERSGTLPVPVFTPSPVVTLRPPRLIGREAEWQAIEAAWQQHKLVVLLGEPGIGKSRLAGDFGAARNQPNLYRAHLGDSRTAYSLLARLLRGLQERFGAVAQDWIVVEFSRLLPELGAAPAGRLEPLRLHQAFAAAMAEWQSRGLEGMVIDDLHFADDATLEMLLASLGQGTRPHIVLTVRANEVPAALSTWLRDVETGTVCELTLAPLGLASIAALLESLAIVTLDARTWAEPLLRHTGGNPLFILETLKLQLSVSTGAFSANTPTLRAPVQIGRLLGRRLEQLTAGALRLARVAALAGPDFSVELAAQVLRCHALDLSEAWAELERAQIIDSGAFAHDLILETTLRSVPQAIATVLHRAVAQALEAIAHAPARVAHHWQRAHEWARAAPHWEQAAKLAHTASRPAESLALWDAAAQCYAQAGAREAAFRARCGAINAAMVVSLSEHVTDRIESLLADSSSDTERFDALLAKAKHLINGSNFAGAISVAGDALDIAQHLSDLRRELQAVNLRGPALTMTGDLAGGLALFEAAAAKLASVGDEWIECEFCSAFSYALCAGGRFRDSAIWVERAIELSQRLGETNELAINLGNFAVTLGHLGKSERALEMARRAQSAHARLGEVQGLPYAVSLVNVGTFSVAAGRFDDALAAYQQALELARDGRAERMVFAVEHFLADTYLLLGQPARVRQLLSRDTAQLDGKPITKARRAVIEWRIESLTSRSSPDPGPLLRAFEELGSNSAVIERLGIELAVVAALPPHAALLRSQQVREQALLSELPATALTALILLADAQRRLGQYEDAARSARKAVAEAAESSARDLQVAEFWWLAFQAFDGAGCAAEAKQALRAGAEWVQRALSHVPEVYRDSFLHRSRVLPELLAMAHGRLDRQNPALSAACNAAVTHDGLTSGV